MAIIPFGVRITHHNTVEDFTPSFKIFTQSFFGSFKMKSANEQFSKLLRVSVTAVATAILVTSTHTSARNEGTASKGRKGLDNLQRQDCEETAIQKDHPTASTPMSTV